MSKYINAKPDTYRWTYELLFSIYCALLVVNGHEARGLGWSARLHNFYASHFRPDLRILTDDGYRLYVFAFFLTWLSAAAVFVCLRLLARLSFSKSFLFHVMPALCVVGFPLASLWSGEGRLPFLEFETAVSALIIVLWTYNKWPVSGTLNVLLLMLHFILWSIFSRFPYLCCLYLWPSWIWETRVVVMARLVYPILGFSCTVLGIHYSRNSQVNRAPVGTNVR